MPITIKQVGTEVKDGPRISKGERQTTTTTLITKENKTAKAKCCSQMVDRLAVTKACFRHAAQSAAEPGGDCLEKECSGH